MKQRWLKWLLVGLVLAAGALYFFQDSLVKYFLRPMGNGAAREGLRTVNMSAGESDEDYDGPQIETVAENLAIPWEIVFLPDESLLVTERPGQLVRIFPDSREVLPITGVAHVGEGGLLGMALHPDFEENSWLYLYFTTRTDGGLTNRIERYRFNMAANSLADRLVIIEGIPGAQFHDGGRLEFGPDDLLYVTTGDAGNQDSAQDVNLVAGKILRLNDDGSVPADNPFSNAVYSYGHRNPQGLAWDGEGRLWSSEHGPSGSQTGDDEVNLIKAGSNYGWPVVRGTQTREGMVPPVIESGRSETWAPADAAIVDDLLIFTGLRGEALYSAEIIGEDLRNFTAHFDGEYGRLRAVVVSPDGQWLYFTTSNTDGRGQPAAADDRIVRVRTSLWKK